MDLEMSQSSEKKTVKCSQCNNDTTMACHGCKKPICNRHSHIIRRAVYCFDCFQEQKKKGLIKSWGMILVLGGIALAVFFLI